MELVVFWFRRDLRYDDNVGLASALKSGFKVLPVFIFDSEIIKNLDKDDARLNFIYDKLKDVNSELNKRNSSLLILKDNVKNAFDKLLKKYKVKAVYANSDYEPYAIARDNKIRLFLKSYGVDIKLFKDQVVFEPNEVLKPDGKPYTIFTPYKNKWLKKLELNFNNLNSTECRIENLFNAKFNFPTLKQLELKESSVKVRDINLDAIKNYASVRDYPYLDGGSYAGPHLRFGTISVRKLVKLALNLDQVFLSELIWREFFMQILFHFPKLVDENFKSQYNSLKWRNNEKEFEKWCNGETGYPIVDAGMKELYQTGYMHNRVRMITAGFLTKHLLVDWRWGESYFAEKLLDYELSSNNGNWQWAGGTGCDAAPYFRIFNPFEQQKKYDKNFIYIKKQIPDFNAASYLNPIVEHAFARNRAIETFKSALLAK